MRAGLLCLLLLTCVTGSAAAQAAVTSVPAGSLVASDNADAWVRFELARDQKTRRGERYFSPIVLGVEAAVGTALAVLPDGTRGQRIASGVGGALAAAALVPTLLSKSRAGSRAWFFAGSTAFTLGLAGSAIAYDLEHRHDRDDPSLREGRWVGAALGVQALAMLPIGFIPGLPSEQEYAAYEQLPAEARPRAAARILRQVDKFEQRSAAIVLVSQLAASLVLLAGITQVDERRARQGLAVVGMLPLATALLTVVPRLFAGSRIERFAVGEAPRKMAFNAW